MRGIDWALATFTAKYWFTGDDSELELCPLLKDPNGFLIYLESIHLKPGLGIPDCPMCGEEHSWPLIRDLLKYMRHYELELHTDLLDFIYGRNGGYLGTKFPPWFPDKSILTKVHIRKPKLPLEPVNMTDEQKEQWDVLIAELTENFCRRLESSPPEDDLKTMIAKRRSTRL